MLEAERFKQGLSRVLQAIGLVLPGVVPELPMTTETNYHPSAYEIDLLAVLTQRGPRKFGQCAKW